MLSQILLLALSFPFPAPAFVPRPELLSSPALLVSYKDWSQAQDRFRAEPSGLAFRNLVEILYDRSNGRPWGAQYLPEANRRLEAFRALACRQAPILSACLSPRSLMSDADLERLTANLSDSREQAHFSAKLGVEVRSWNLPLREPLFSLLAGVAGITENRRAVYWTFPEHAQSWTEIRYPVLWDPYNYREGFEGREAPAIFTLTPGGALMNDWLLRSRAMDFAARWKYAVEFNRRHKPASPIIDFTERRFQASFEARQAELAETYAALFGRVEGVPAVRERFEKERATGDFPEEVYQHVAYRALRELVLEQGTFLAAAEKNRPGQSARQRALESLLSLQRHAGPTDTFVTELGTLMEPLQSHAFVLDEMADAALAQTLVMEELKALLGAEPYKEPLFPRLGRGLLLPELFAESYLSEYAPELKVELAGREFATLDTPEQLRLLRLYLSPTPGKVRPMSLYRLATAWLDAAGEAELRELADRVHGQRFPK